MTVRRAKNNDDNEMGIFYLPSGKLQLTIIILAKEFALYNREQFDKELEDQFKERQMKEEIDLRKKYLNATEEYIVAVYFFEQYLSS